MKQKRDANGKFVKMYLTREEYDAKVAELEKDVNRLALVAQDAKNQTSFWRQEYNEIKRISEEQRMEITDLQLVKFWFLKHCGPILRWRFYKAVEEEAL
jgi:hypothetical protein